MINNTDNLAVLVRRYVIRMKTVSFLLLTCKSFLITVVYLSQTSRALNNIRTAVYFSARRFIMPLHVDGSFFRFVFNISNVY
jgi:hypothetical protein